MVMGHYRWGRDDYSQIPNFYLIHPTTKAPLPCHYRLPPPPYHLPPLPPPAYQSVLGWSGGRGWGTPPLFHLHIPGFHSDTYLPTCRATCHLEWAFYLPQALPLLSSPLPADILPGIDLEGRLNPEDPTGPMPTVPLMPVVMMIDATRHHLPPPSLPAHLEGGLPSYHKFPYRPTFLGHALPLGVG